MQSCRAPKPELIAAARHYPWVVPTVLFAGLIALGVLVG